MDTDNESVLVKLTRMEGKLDLSNMRHDQHDERFRTIDGRLHAHGQRIGALETKDSRHDGERAGVRISARAMWTVGAFFVAEAIALVGLAARLM